MKDLKGRRALVCGSSSGIGRAIAVALADRGAELLLLARSRERLEALAVEAKARGAANASVLAVDLEDLPATEATVGAALGGGPIHILINNTGGPPSGPLIDAAPDDFLRAFRRHVLAAHSLSRLLVPGMKSASWGRIVNVISTSVREPIPGLGVSNTIRGAMASWAKTMAKELPPGITINNVLPGFTATDRLKELGEATAKRLGKTPAEIETGWLATIPEGRLADPSEIAALAVFLCSPAASYVRGQSIAADGGRLSGI